MGKRQNFLSTAGSQRKTGVFREAELRRGDSIWVHLREAVYAA